MAVAAAAVTTADAAAIAAAAVAAGVGADLVRTAALDLGREEADEELTEVEEEIWVEWEDSISHGVGVVGGSCSCSCGCSVIFRSDGSEVPGALRR